MFEQVVTWASQLIKFIVKMTEHTNTKFVIVNIAGVLILGPMNGTVFLTEDWTVGEPGNCDLETDVGYLGQCEYLIRESPT